MIWRPGNYRHSTSFRLLPGRMAGDGGPFKMDPSQELKRTRDMFSDVTRLDQANDTGNSDKENKDGSMKTLVERVSIECTTQTHKPS